MTNTEFLKECKEAGINDYELLEVRKGLMNGLSIEEVGIYAKDTFDAGKMEQIRICITEKVPINDEILLREGDDIRDYRIAFYQNQGEKRIVELFDLDRKEIHSQIEEMSINMTKLINEVELAKNEGSRQIISLCEIIHKIYDSTSNKVCNEGEEVIVNTPDKKESILTRLMKNINKKSSAINENDIEKIITEGNYTADQIEQITIGIENGLSDEQIKSYAKREYSADQMIKLRKFIEAKNSRDSFSKKEDEIKDNVENTKILDVEEDNQKSENEELDFSNDQSDYTDEYVLEDIDFEDEI